MYRVIILGSSNAIPTRDHENTHMVVAGSERMVLVDCVGNPVLRLEQAGLDFNALTDIVITHFHPDHVSGLPLLLMDMWLMGRTRPINIYGLHYTLDRIEDLMRFYSWAEWPDFYPVAFHRLPASENSPVLDCPDFKVISSPVRHLIPTIGLRFELHQGDKVLAYSCDTEPCTQVVQLADGADILIHEASGENVGHSSASQAASIAAQAEVGALYLIHYPTGPYADGDLLAEARTKYAGPITLATDFMVLEL
jgi:ribonuclease Z